MIASVIIPTYNRRERLERVLAALAAQTVAQSEFEVIVVSDGSTDDTDEYLNSGQTPLDVVAVTQPNSGPGPARNTGVAIASGSLVIFVDDDVVASPDLVAQHLASHRRTVGDGPRVVVGPMRLPTDFVAQAWIRWEQDKLEAQYAAMVRGEWEPTFRQFYTGNVSLPKRLLQESGGFDAQYRRAEDVELAYRLRELGSRFEFNPAAIGWHYAERSFEAWLGNAYDYGTNDVAFAREHGREELLRIVADEFPQRNGVIRAAVRASVGRRRIGRAAQTALNVGARATAQVPPALLASSLLSAAYNVAYYRGLADALGGREAFAEVVLLRSRHSGLPESKRPVLVTVSGTIDPDLGREVADGLRPRPDFLVLADELDAQLLDHRTARERAGWCARTIARVVGNHALVAWVCFRERDRYRVILTDGEQVGLPLALLWRLRRPGTTAHVMIVHIMSVPLKRLAFRTLGLQRRIDAMIVYSSWQQRFLVEELGVSPHQVMRSPFMVDTRFFAPERVVRSSTNTRVVATAGLERRDYGTLVEAAQGLDARVVIAAASNWSRRTDRTSSIELPANVEVCSLTFEPLRAMYASADVVVMPLHDVEFQAGVTTILEAMAMGKPVVCSRTEGQTDLVVDGVSGVYVPPGDPVALRTAIGELLSDRDRLRAMGKAARTFAEHEADIEVYARSVAELVESVNSTTDRAEARSG